MLQDFHADILFHFLSSEHIGSETELFFDGVMSHVFLHFFMFSFQIHVQDVSWLRCYAINIYRSRSLLDWMGFAGPGLFCPGL